MYRLSGNASAAAFSFLKAKRPQAFVLSIDTRVVAALFLCRLSVVFVLLRNPSGHFARGATADSDCWRPGRTDSFLVPRFCVICRFCRRLRCWSASTACPRAFSPPTSASLDGTPTGVCLDAIPTRQPFAWHQAHKCACSAERDEDNEPAHQCGCTSLALS